MLYDVICYMMSFVKYKFCPFNWGATCAVSFITHNLTTEKTSAGATNCKYQHNISLYS